MMLPPATITQINKCVSKYVYVYQPLMNNTRYAFNENTTTKNLNIVKHKLAGYSVCLQEQIIS